MLVELEKLAFQYFTDWRQYRRHSCKRSYLIECGKRCCGGVKWGDMVVGSGFFFNGTHTKIPSHFKYFIWQYHPGSGFWIPIDYWFCYASILNVIIAEYRDELIKNITVSLYSKRNNDVHIIHTYFNGPFCKCVIVADIFVARSKINSCRERFAKLFHSEQIAGHRHSRLCIQKSFTNSEVIYCYI